MFLNDDKFQNFPILFHFSSSKEGVGPIIRLQKAFLCTRSIWKATGRAVDVCTVISEQCSKKQFTSGFQLVCHQPGERPDLARQVPGLRRYELPKDPLNLGAQLGGFKGPAKGK